MYEYKASIIDVHDGDTVHAIIDLGMDIHVATTLRLYGINAPELPTAKGWSARSWLIDRLADHEVITVRTYKDKKEKYGRYLATLYDDQGKNVNDEMVMAGHAAPYFGGKR
jgi:micrococcal nuclease